MSKEFTDFMSKLTEKDDNILLSIKLEKILEVYMANFLNIWNFDGIEKSVVKLSQADEKAKIECNEIINKLTSFMVIAKSAKTKFNETISVLMEMVNLPDLSINQKKQIIENANALLFTISGACAKGKRYKEEIIGMMMLVSLNVVDRQINKED